MRYQNNYQHHFRKRKQERKREMANDLIQIERNVVYWDTGEEKLTADVYRPIEGDNLPAVLLIHGGAYQSGSKEMYAEWGHLLANAGFVAMAINYRLASPKAASWPGVLEDVRMAVNWLVGKAHDWNIEPQRMGIIGDSAGAHLGSLFAFQTASSSSFKIRACVCVYGLYDMTKPGSERIKQINRQLFGKEFHEAQLEYIEASPVNYIEEAVSSPTFNTSFFLLWGDADRVVSPLQSESFSDQLKQAGFDVETMVFPGQGHFWLNLTTGLKGGTLNDYPNTVAAPKIMGFLKDKLCFSNIGNFSPRQTQRLVSLQSQKM